MLAASSSRAIGTRVESVLTRWKQEHHGWQWRPSMKGLQGLMSGKEELGVTDSQHMGCSISKTEPPFFSSSSSSSRNKTTTSTTAMFYFYHETFHMASINGLKGHKMRQVFESRFFNPSISQKMAQQPQIVVMMHCTSPLSTKKLLNLYDISSSSLRQAYPLIAMEITYIHGRHRTHKTLFVLEPARGHYHCRPRCSCTHKYILFIVLHTLRSFRSYIFTM